MMQSEQTRKVRHAKFSNIRLAASLLFAFLILLSYVHVSAAAQSGLVLITIANNVPVATTTPFQMPISFNPKTYNAIEANDLGNIRFYQGSTELYSWCESGCNSTATSATFWVKLGGSIPANSNITVIMSFLSGNAKYDGIYAGEAPQLSSTYGQYDNGKNVFNVYFNGKEAASNFTMLNPASGDTLKSQRISIDGKNLWVLNYTSGNDVTAYLTYAGAEQPYDWTAVDTILDGYEHSNLQTTWGAAYIGKNWNNIPKSGIAESLSISNVVTTESQDTLEVCYPFAGFFGPSTAFPKLGNPFEVFLWIDGNYYSASGRFCNNTENNPGSAEDEIWGAGINAAGEPAINPVGIGNLISSTDSDVDSMEIGGETTSGGFYDAYPLIYPELLIPWPNGQFPSYDALNMNNGILRNEWPSATFGTFGNNYEDDNNGCTSFYDDLSWPCWQYSSTTYTTINKIDTFIWSNLGYTTANPSVGAPVSPLEYTYNQHFGISNVLNDMVTPLPYDPVTASDEALSPFNPQDGGFSAALNTGLYNIPYIGSSWPDPVPKALLQSALNNINYSNYPSTTDAHVMIGQIAPPGNSTFWTWVRVRALPPMGVYPNVSFSTVNVLIVTAGAGDNTPPSAINDYEGILSKEGLTFLYVQLDTPQYTQLTGQQYLPVGDQKVGDYKTEINGLERATGAQYLLILGDATIIPMPDVAATDPSVIVDEQAPITPTSPGGERGLGLATAVVPTDDPYGNLFPTGLNMPTVVVARMPGDSGSAIAIMLENAKNAREHITPSQKIGVLTYAAIYSYQPKDRVNGYLSRIEESETQDFMTLTGLPGSCIDGTGDCFVSPPYCNYDPPGQIYLPCQPSLLDNQFLTNYEVEYIDCHGSSWWCGGPASYSEGILDTDTLLPVLVNNPILMISGCYDGEIPGTDVYLHLEQYYRVSSKDTLVTYLLYHGASVYIGTTLESFPDQETQFFSDTYNHLNEGESVGNAFLKAKTSLESETDNLDQDEGESMQLYGDPTLGLDQFGSQFSGS